MLANLAMDRYTLRSCCIRMQHIYAGARSTRFGIGAYIQCLLGMIQRSWRRKMKMKSSTCLLWEHTTPMAPLHIYPISLVRREGMEVIPQNRVEAH